MPSASSPALRRIRTLARCVRAMCLLGMGTLLALPLLFWTQPDWVEQTARQSWNIGEHAMQLDGAARLAGFAAGLAPLGLALAALWQIWRLFGCYARAEVFSARASRHLLRLAQAVITLAPALPLGHTLAVLALTWRNPPGQRLLVFGLSSQHYLALLLGLVLLAMALVMREAQRMAQENAEFV